MWSVSVILTAHDRTSFLRLCLASIETQTVRPHEVVIAAGVESTRAIEELVERSPLRIVLAPGDEGSRPAALRNGAVRHATGDYLFLTDADAVLFPDVLERHLAAAGRRRWVGGYGLRLTPHETAQVTEERVRAGKLEELWPGADDPRCLALATDATELRARARWAWLLRSEQRVRRLRLSTAQASMPRAAFERVNGFDEEFEGWGYEEPDLGLRLQIAGLRARTVMPASRVLRLYHDPLPRSGRDRARYGRPRHGQCRCTKGLDGGSQRPEGVPAAPAAPAGAQCTTIAPPRFLFVHVNKRCNLRCQHCVYWKLDDSDRANYMPWDRKREVIHEFAEMSPGGAVVICGGEKMLDPDDYFAIATECARTGLRALSVINGTQVTDEQVAERVIREGPAEVSVSLDSYIEEDHDRMRGVKGTFRLAANALRLLLRARERHPELGKRVYAMALVHEGNYRDLDAFYDFVLNDIGADKLKLNFLQPTFGLSGPDDFFARYHIRDPEALAAVIRACDAKYRLGLNPAWLEHVGMYFRSVNHNGDAHLGWGSDRGTEEHICNSYERNIMVDLYGTARLCFSAAFPGFPLVNRGDLRYFWHYFSGPIRAKMRQCNRYCAISHSVRRENATLKPAEH